MRACQKAICVYRTRRSLEDFRCRRPHELSWSHATTTAPLRRTGYLFSVLPSDLTTTAELGTVLRTSEGADRLRPSVKNRLELQLRVPRKLGDVMRKTLPFLVVAAVAISCVNAWGQASKGLDVYFIDVEGGQSTLFVTPTGESLLVDTGWPGSRDADRIARGPKQAGTP